MTRRALVVGGSIGGLIAGNLLRRLGFDVTIFERAPGDLAGRGVGLGLSSELLAVMRRCGARIDPSIVIPVPETHWVDRDGTVIHREQRGWLLGAWQRTYRCLRDAVPDAIYRGGRAVVRVEQDADGVTAIFADGARERGDMLVAADGLHSTVRRHYLPEIAPRYAGYVAWRGLVAEGDIDPADREALFAAFTISAPERELALCMPAPDPDEDQRAGQRRLYFIWYRPTDAAGLAALCTDSGGRNHGLSIPPPQIRPDVIAEMKADAARLLPRRVAAVIHRTAQPLLQPITDCEVPHMVWGRVALLGDAAFVARPHVAAGVTKAALDAACLADALAEADGIAAAFARYDRERVAWGQALVAHSRHLGTFIGAPAGSAARRDPASYLADYGAPHLIHQVRPEDLRGA